MIPKNLFLLWIGKKPAFLDNVIDAYKTTNPDFNIREYIFEFDELEKQDDICVKNTLSYIDQTFRLNQKNKWYDFLKMVTRGSGKRGFATYFSDVLRQELVETHGGIYVDTDTWPVRKFDDKLLSLKHFNAIAHPDNREYFFFGAEAGTNSWFDSYDENNYFEKDIYDALDYSYNTYLIFDRQKYLQNKSRLMNCQLKLGDFYKDPLHYVDHYMSSFWRNPQHVNNKSKFDSEYSKFY